MKISYKHFRLQLIIQSKLELGVVMKTANDYRLQAFNSPMDSKSPLPAQIEVSFVCLFLFKHNYCPKCRRHLISPQYFHSHII